MKESTKVILSGIIGLLVGALSVWLYKKYIEKEKYQSELGKDVANLADLYGESARKFLEKKRKVQGSDKTDKPSIYNSFGALGFVATNDVIVADLTKTQQEDQAHYTKAGFYLDPQQREALANHCNSMESSDKRYECLREVLSDLGKESGDFR